MNLPGIRFLTGEDFYTDWFGRGGDNMLFRLQPIDFVGTVTVTVKFYTKNPDDTSSQDGTVVKDSGGTDYSVTMTNSDTRGTVKQLFVTSTSTSGQGLKQLVRLRISVTGDADSSLLGRIFAPIFYDKAAP